MRREADWRGVREQGQAAVQSQGQEDLQADSFPLCLPFQQVAEGRVQASEGSALWHTSDNPALAACQTLSPLLPGGEQISRKKVTAVCTLCMWHLTQSTSTAWGK